MRARPTSSGTVSPFARSAIRKAPVWTSLGAPFHDLGEDRRGVVGGQVLAGGDRVDRPGQDVVGHQPSLEEVLEQALALRRQHRLGVELDALGGQLAVAGAHHDVAEAGAHLELVGQVGVGDQRVVAAGDQRGRQALRRASRPSCSTSASLPWIGSPWTVRPPNASTSDWWPRQTPSTGVPASAKARIASLRDPGLGRRAGAGRDDQAVGAALEQLGDLGLVVADDLDLGRRARPGTGRGCR